jgi:hypothetical protein
MNTLTDLPTQDKTQPRKKRPEPSVTLVGTSEFRGSLCRKYKTKSGITLCSILETEDGRS